MFAQNGPHGNIDMGAMCSKNFQHSRQMAPRCLTVVIYNGSKLHTGGGQMLLSTIVLLSDVDVIVYCVGS